MDKLADWYWRNERVVNRTIYIGQIVFIALALLLAWSEA